MKVLTAENALFQAQNKVEQEKTNKEIARIKAEENARIESLKRMNALARKRAGARLDQPDEETGEKFDREKFTAQEENILNDLIEKNKELNQSNLDGQLDAYEGLLEALKQGSVVAQNIFNQTTTNNKETLKKNLAELTKAYSEFFDNLGENLLAQTDGGSIFGKAITMLFDPDEFKSRLTEVMQDMQSQIGATLTVIGERFGQFAQLLKSVFGEEGAGAVAMSQFMSSVSMGFGNIAEAMTTMVKDGKLTAEGIGEILGSVTNMIAGLGSAMDGYNKSRIAAVDKEIEAEKKKDGKSKESLQKIHKMEQQKEALGRKSFEQQKKMNIGLTIMNTAVAAMGAFASMTALAGPAAGAAAAAAIAVIGAAQVAMISKQQYSGFTAGDAPSVDGDVGTTKIGARGNEVDVSQRANRGELAFLRGGQGTGSISNFTPAASGRRGYAVGSEGVVVGERGPEVISPSMPVDITPNDQLQQTATNVNFTIHAVDAAGLEQTIQSQRGNIIGMIREAANGYGENFLEQVDVDTLDTTGGSY